MITVEAALEIILNEIKPLGLERVTILSALGRVLGEDIIAGLSNPPWDNSAMDGYAIKASDIKGASKEKPVILEVVEDLPAGYIAKNRVGSGQAIRIMTGAPVPDGADSVIMVEDTEQQTQGAGSKAHVKILKEIRGGDNIRKAGEDFKTGDMVLKRGTTIRPAEIGMLAAVGIPNVSVFQQPRVAVLSTGDELVEIEETPPAGKIINSNSYAISAQIKDCGALPIQLGIARDRREDLQEKLRHGLAADCIISSGGVSVGDFDFVKDVLREMGSEMRFWKVAMKPGKPLAFGIIKGKPAFGLPGNPISAMVAFEQFVRPALLKIMGRRDIFKRPLDAILTKSVKKQPGRMQFVRAFLEQREELWYATPLEGQGSGMLRSMAQANCFIILPQDSQDVLKDNRVKVQPLDWNILYQGRPGY